MSIGNRHESKGDIMKATLVLSGKTRDIKAIVGLAVESGVVESFTTDTVEDEPKSRKPGPSRPIAKTPPFEDGAKVSKEYQTQKSHIPRFSTGTIKEQRVNRGGWSALVEWDNPSLDTDWIMSTALKVER